MNFSDLGLSKRTVAFLETAGLVEPTEVQLQAIPLVIEGHDLMASAETGSGKTAAYALPIIETIISTSMQQPRVLVLVPTRELAIQVETQFQRFSRGSGMRSVTVYGGAGFDRQTKFLKRGVDVVVATPGCLKDHIDRGNVDLSKVIYLVLDEADRMLDMGFMPQVRQILKTVPRDRQTLLFSATFDRSVEQSAADFLKNPKRIQINSKRIEPISIDQKIFNVEESSKDELLVKLLSEVPDNNAILVFARTRRKVTKIKKRLCAANVLADEIHGDISQNKRERTLSRYRDGEFTVLVATDVAARGLDIPAISHVVNYDLPDCAEDYVHRIGRTGRAGRAGSAISFVSAGQRSMMRDIEKVTGKRFDAKSDFVGSNPVAEQQQSNAGGKQIPGQKMEGSRRYKAERGIGRAPRSERLKEFGSENSESHPFDGGLTESSIFRCAPKVEVRDGKSSDFSAGSGSRSGNGSRTGTDSRKRNASRKSDGWVKQNASDSRSWFDKQRANSRSNKPGRFNDSGKPGQFNKTGDSDRPAGSSKQYGSGTASGSKQSNRSHNSVGSFNGKPGKPKSKPGNAGGMSKKLQRRHFRFGKNNEQTHDVVIVW